MDNISFEVKGKKKKLFEITRRTGSICPLWFTFKTYSQRPPWLTDRCGSKRDRTRIFVDVGNSQVSV